MEGNVFQVHFGMDYMSVQHGWNIYLVRKKEGISVMKSFNAGQLLDEAKLSLHQVLMPGQCIQYALDRLGVIFAMQGAADIAQFRENLSYLEITLEKRDYSVIGSFIPDDTMGSCVYCRCCHCSRCPIHANQMERMTENAAYFGESKC